MTDREYHYFAMNAIRFPLSIMNIIIYRLWILLLELTRALRIYGCRLKAPEVRYMSQVTWIFPPKSAVCHHGIPWMFAKFSTERPHPLCKLAAGTYQLRNTFLRIRLSRVVGETVFTVLVKAA